MKANNTSLKIIAIVVAAITIATATTLIYPTPQNTNGLSWRYYTIQDGTKADKQIDAIVYRYPARATVWPQRRIATSYSYFQNPLGGLSCLAGAEPYTRRAVCRGWEVAGPTGGYRMTVSIEATWDGTGFKDEGWFNMQHRTYCNPIQSIGMTLNLINCGVQSEGYSTITLGLYFSTTTQAYTLGGASVPQVTVWWRSYIICNKDLGTCYEPFTVPAG